MAGTDSTQRESMRAQLGRLPLLARGQAGAGEEGAIDEATATRLRALGYVK